MLSILHSGRNRNNTFATERLFSIAPSSMKHVILWRSWRFIYMDFPTVISFEISYEFIVRSYFIENVLSNFPWNSVWNHSLNVMSKISYEISHTKYLFTMNLCEILYEILWGMTVVNLMWMSLQVRPMIHTLQNKFGKFCCQINL